MPATVVMSPLGATLRIRLLPPSAMKNFPAIQGDTDRAVKPSAGGSCERLRGRQYVVMASGLEGKAAAELDLAARSAGQRTDGFAEIGIANAGIRICGSEGI